MVGLDPDLFVSIQTSSKRPPKRQFHNSAVIGWVQDGVPAGPGIIGGKG